MMIEDRGGNGYAALEAAARDVAEAAAKDPAVTNTYVNFNSRSPRLNAQVDRDKAEMLGVPASNVFATMQTYLAGTYVNNINLLGHTFQVIAMADAPFRQDSAWVGTLKTRSNSGAMVPLSSVANFEPAVGPVQGVSLQPVSGGGHSGRGRAGRLHRAGDGGDGAHRARPPAAGLHVRVDRHRVSAAARGQRGRR